MALPLIGLAASLAAEFAPDVVRFFAGDSAADATDKVIGAVKDITGKDDPDEAAAMLRANPELALKFQERSKEIDASLEKAYLKDRQDARARDVKLRQAGYHNYRADFMLFLAFASFAFITYFIFDTDTIPPEVLAIFNMAIGALLKMISDAFQFEFGSSRGSKEKDKSRY